MDDDDGVGPVAASDGRAAALPASLGPGRDSGGGIVPVAAVAVVVTVVCCATFPAVSPMGGDECAGEALCLSLC